MKKMNVWDFDNWKTLDKSYFLKSGLFLHFEKSVNRDLRLSCIRFCKWLRKEYFFPIRVDIYFKKDVMIKSVDGRMVCSACWQPDYKEYHPYIRIATGDFDKLVLERGRDNAVATFLQDIARMLTHYYQWLNDLDLSTKQEKTQASQCAASVLKKYAQTHQHP